MKISLLHRAAVPLALSAFALLSGPASAQQAAAPMTAAPPTNMTLSREDVVRDLAAWKNAGLEQQWSGDETPDINGPAYMADYMKYIETVRPNAASQYQAPTQSPRKW